jgi:hypothetical protein
LDLQLALHSGTDSNNFKGTFNMRFWKKLLGQTNFHETPPKPEGLGIVFLWIYFLIWLGGVAFLYINWQTLPSWAKYSLAVIEFLLAPDLSIFNDLFGWKRKK